MVKASSAVTTVSTLVVPGLIDTFSKTFLGKFWR